MVRELRSGEFPSAHYDEAKLSLPHTMCHIMISSVVGRYQANHPSWGGGRQKGRVTSTTDSRATASSSTDLMPSGSGIWHAYKLLNERYITTPRSDEKKKKNKPPVSSRACHNVEHFGKGGGYIRPMTRRIQPKGHIIFFHAKNI